MPKSADLELRAATLADVPAIVELLAVSLGTGRVPRDAGYWNWKHVENPFGPSAVLLAFTENRLVGVRAFMRWEWQADAEIVRAVRAVDTATHPEFQGRGIFSRLTLALVDRMRDEGVQLIFNTPNAKSGAGYLKMGWHSVGKTDLSIRPRPLRIAAAQLHSKRTRQTESTLMPVSEVLERPGVEELVAADNAVFSAALRTRRSLPYLVWRYQRTPGFEYSGVADIQRGSGALLVTRYKNHGAIRELRICDLMVSPGDASMKKATELLKWLVHKADADFLSIMAPRRSEQRRALMRAAFLPAPRLGPLLFARPLKSSNTQGLQSRDWALTIGDLELF